MVLIPATYTRVRGRAVAGQIADTSLYNVDGACVADISGDNIPVGVFVSVKNVEPVDGHKVVQVGVASGLQILGATMFSQAYANEGYYEPGRATNVVTHGRLWVLCDTELTDAQSAFGLLVKITTEGIVSNSGTHTTGYKFTGERLTATDGNTTYNLVKVQLLEGQGGVGAASGS